MANWYQKTGDEVLKEFGVTTDGLSRQKAEELLHSQTLTGTMRICWSSF